MPLVPFKIIDDSPINFSDQIVSQIQQQIGEGKLLPGERMPSMRSASKLLNIGVVTVNKAYMKLVRNEVLVSHGSKGVFVRDLSFDEVALVRDERLMELLSKAKQYADASGATKEDVISLLTELYEEGGSLNE